MSSLSIILHLKVEFMNQFKDNKFVEVWRRSGETHDF